MLRLLLRPPKPQLAEAELEAAAIANVSRQFEELGLDIPLLNVYERSKTKVTVTRLWSRTDLVSQAIDTTP